jgi:hypothetical protein
VIRLMWEHVRRIAEDEEQVMHDNSSSPLLSNVPLECMHEVYLVTSPTFSLSPRRRFRAVESTERQTRSARWSHRRRARTSAKLNHVVCSEALVGDTR